MIKSELSQALYKQRWSKLFEPVMNLDTPNFKQKIILCTLINSEDYSRSKSPDGEFQVYIEVMGRNLGLPIRQLHSNIEDLVSLDIVKIISKTRNNLWVIEFTQQFEEFLLNMCDKVYGNG